jgi:Ca2+-binding RTX toxin-like protein
MSYDEALLLTESGDNWNSLTIDNVTALNYTEYISGNPIPTYYFTDNIPANDDWSSTYTGTLGVAADSQSFLTDPQADLITFYLSAVTGIDYRVSFADVSNLQFTDKNSPDAPGEIFISSGNITDANTFGITGYPTGNPTSSSTWAGDVVLDNAGSTTVGGVTYDHATVMSQTDIGQMGADIILHELAHSIGLLHATADACYVGDYATQKYTIMTDSPLSADPDMDPSVHPTDLQLFDIAAVQSLYGVNWGGVRGDGGALENTIYSGHTAFATDNTNNAAFIYTIWDGAGIDVIDATGYGTPAEIDLRQGHFSSIGYKGDSGDTSVAFDSGGVDHGNVAIAYFTVIENAIGTDGDDTLIGNAWNNVLFGNGGNDKIYGDGVTYDGDAGDHAANTNKDASGTVLDWGPDGIAYASDLSGNDVLIGGGGNDTLYGGLGNDVLDGGYNKTDIDDATAGWSTYWDAAGEITGSNNYNGTAFGNVTTTGDDYADYSMLPLGTSHTGIDVTFSGSVDYGIVSKGVSGALGTDTLLAIGEVVGTSQQDTFNDSNGGGLTYRGGGGSDTYNFTTGDSGSVQIIEPSLASGVDLITLNSSFVMAINGSNVSGHVGFLMDLYSDWNSGTSTYDHTLSLYFDTSTLGDGFGVEDVQIGSGSEIMRGADLANWWIDNYTGSGLVTGISLSDLYSDVESFSATGWNGGTGGTGAGGGVLPTYDGLGNVSSMQISPAVGGSPISYGIADVIDHTLVLTSFSESYSGGTYTSTAGWQTYEQAFDFIGGITPGDVRLTASGSQGAAALTINIDSLDFSLTISDFETGNTISGIEVYNSTLHGLIQDASGSTLVSTGVNTFGGSYLTLTGLSVDLSGSVTEHYFLEALNFAGGGSIDLTAPITFTGTDSGESLTGLDDRADTIYGMGGDDIIYSYGGNDTLVGGAGDDELYGGIGNDTYVFAAGWGSDIVHENTGEGTDTLHFTGIAPSDIRMYTDAYGGLHLVDISDSANNITVYAGVTGSGTSESAIGSYVESVTFDSSYSTTWDLTGGLNLAGDNSGDYLYGTAYADTITGGTGADVIYANGGNDTIIGGAGDDDLYGGTGNDTYVFSSGFGNAIVHENASEGTDTIHFTGINPADIRLWTDNYGNLILQDTSDPSHSITVVAGVTGSGTSESAISSYVESVTFDSGYSTTWDLTGGLNITGDNSGDYLYGTAYGDTITGGAGADVIYANGGNDTIIGGAGDDYLVGGTGNDTYVFSSGFGSSSIHENTSEGTDAIHFSGINPADIRLWTDAYGTLYLQDTSDTSHSISVNAGVTGSGTSESTIGSYVESVTFDSSYSTTWDLTGGLHITGDNSGDYLYGTAYGDTITGGTGADVIHGNGGNDTIIGGAGDDTLYGDTGNDTYVFSSGFGSAIVHENLSEGTDTIRFSGIDPADIRLWTDAYGNLMLQDTSDTSHSITVNAGVTGDNTSESTIGSYVESVTFDSGYSTTWDLTAGLNITGDNSGDYLYGTAHGDTITGGTGADVVYGNAGDDVLYGAGGNDYLYGGPGADTFLFKAATAETGVATIMDFNTSDGDKIDLANVISTYDPMTMLIANFVQLATSGSDTQVKVDTDGSGTSYTQIATITGVTGLNLADLITDGNLVVHHT